MGRYIIRRLIQAVPLLILISIAMYGLIRLLPGGPDQVIFNPHLSAAGRAALRAKFGLDQPVPIQYLKWAANMLQGDFGYSFQTNQPVSEILAQRFPNTLELFVSALVLALILAIILGIIAAVRQGSTIDFTLMALSYLGISTPVFVLGLVAQNIFAVQLHWLPTSGTATLGYTLSPVDSFIDHLQHLILPMLVLAIAFIAGWSRYMRSSMIEVIKQDYMRTAKAKGLAPTAALFRHAIRNAVIPLITVVAINFGGVAGGAAITEGVFAWPGMGLQFLQSLDARDYPVLMAMLVLSAVFVVAFNLIADILYAVMDPRIRYS